MRDQGNKVGGVILPCIRDYGLGAFALDTRR